MTWGSAPWNSSVRSPLGALTKPTCSFRHSARCGGGDRRHTLLASALSFGNELGLRVKGRLASIAQLVDTVRLHDLGFDIVAPEPLKDFVDVFLHSACDDRENRLDPAEKVARHPIGAAEINFWIAAIFEAENAAVLQKSSDNTAYFDIFAHVGNADSQGAHSTDHQANIHAGC